MSDIPDAVDINDVFDNIFLFEDQLQKKHYDEGYKDGIKSGNTDGYHLGYHRGTEIGAELGYYYGVVISILKNKSNFQFTMYQSAEQIKNSIDKFPNNNSADFDIIIELDNIRTQFKKIASILKIEKTFEKSKQSLKNIDF